MLEISARVSDNRRYVEIELEEEATTVHFFLSPEQGAELAMNITQVLWKTRQPDGLDES